MIKIRMAFVMLLSLALPSAAMAKSEWPTQRRQLAVSLDAAIKRFDLPGVAVGVWTPRGDWVVTKGYADLADKRQLRGQDRFGIRSVTKSFTVTAILQLVASGRLGLDDKVGKYVQGVPNGHLITIRQLANMTSGLMDYSRFDQFVKSSLPIWTGGGRTMNCWPSHSSKSPSSLPVPATITRTPIPCCLARSSRR